MGFDQLKAEVCRVNQALAAAGLAVLTWGNASGADRKAGVMAIKPSGVPYDRLTPRTMVVVALETGAVVEGAGQPSSDTPTHLHLYRYFSAVRGIVHSHSDFATSLAQAGHELPCLGTTHADNFYGAIPCTRAMSDAEIQRDYELNTGRVIVECFKVRGLDAGRTPAVLVRQHGPFAWGPTPEKALENAVVLEFAAKMFFQTRLLNPQAAPLSPALLEKHFFRKHGPEAYYGQETKRTSTDGPARRGRNQNTCAGGSGPLPTLLS